jgi:hypothetical protein
MRNIIYFSIRLQIKKYVARRVGAPFAIDCFPDMQDVFSKSN